VGEKYLLLPIGYLFFMKNICPKSDPWTLLQKTDGCAMDHADVLHALREEWRTHLEIKSQVLWKD
jgi:hypothetical protein